MLSSRIKANLFLMILHFKKFCKSKGKYLKNERVKSLIKVSDVLLV